MAQTPPIRRANQLGLDVELRAIRNGGWRFPNHWHDDLQVIITLHGRGQAFVEGCTYDLPEGALIVVPPRAVHSAWAATNQGWTFHSLHAAPERLVLVPTSIILADKSSGGLLIQLARGVVDGLFDGSGGAAPSFAAFLNEIARQPRDPGRPTVPAKLIVARHALSEKLHARVSIPELATRLGYSTGHLSRAFKAAFFMSPHAWRLTACIEAAKFRLRTGSSVEQAAKYAGFRNLSHFSRQYRTLTGITARAYSARFREANRVASVQNYSRKANVEFALTTESLHGIQGAVENAFDDAASRAHD